MLLMQLTAGLKKTGIIRQGANDVCISVGRRLPVVANTFIRLKSAKSKSM